MTDESTFQIISILLFAIGMPIAAYHRIQSIKGGEKLSRVDEGKILIMLRFVLVIPPFVAVLLYMIHPPLMSWSSVAIPPFLRWIGVGVGTINIPFLYWTLHSLGKNLTDTVVTRKEHTLITHGPYRWIRHPFYACFFLGWVIGIPLLSANWFIGLMAFLIFIVIGVIRVRIEEAKLMERFGDEYRQYRERTGKFLPKWHSFVN